MTAIFSSSPGLLEEAGVFTLEGLTESGLIASFK